MPDLALTHDALLTALTDEGLPALCKAKIPAKVAYVLSKARRKGAEAQADFEAGRQKLIEQMGKRGEDDKLIVVDIPASGGTPAMTQYQFDDPKAFTSALNDLLKQQITLEGVRPVTIAELGDVPVSPNTLLLCGPFITE